MVIEYNDGLAILDQVGALGDRRLVNVYDYEYGTCRCEIYCLLGSDEYVRVFFASAYECIDNGLYITVGIIHYDISILSENFGDTVDTYRSTESIGIGISVSHDEYVFFGCDDLSEGLSLNPGLDSRILFNRL